MKYLIFILTLCCSGAALAQTGIISGIVKTSDQRAAEFVMVGLKGTSKGTTTDKKGAFQIKNVTPGSYVLTVPVMGAGEEEQAVAVAAGETTHVVITLKESYGRLEEVVVTGGRNRYNANNISDGLRMMTPIQELPQNIQVVTKSMLKDQQAISMSDGLIRNVSGLVRMEHWGDMYTNITARGSQIQAFRNGFNVVNSYWGPLTEDMSFVENIEFVKGPAGFMLSSGDPSGMYNVVTKKPTGETRGEATITMGSFDLYRGTLDLDGRLSKNGRLLYRLNLAAQNKKSFRANEYNNRYVIAPVLSYQLDEKTKLTFEYDYQRADMSNVGSYYIFDPKGYATKPVDFTMLPAGLPGVKVNDHSLYLNIEHQLNDNWKLTAQAARFIYNQRGASAWPSVVNPDGTIIRNVGIWDAHSTMTMGQVFVNGSVNTGFVHHNILAGLDMSNKDYIADWSQSHDLDDTSDYFDMNDPAEDVNHISNGYPDFDRSKPLQERAQMGYGYQNQTYTSIYVQDELGFLDNRVRLTLAGRYTDLKQAYAGPADKAQHFTPRVGLSVSLVRQTAV
jgi:iron complex outermembrane receptor protein